MIKVVTTIFVALVTGLFVAPVARAQQVKEDQGFPVERLRIALDRTGIQGAEAGSVLPPFALDAGIWLDYVDDPLVIYDRDTGDRVGSLLHRRVGGALFGAFGVMPRLQVGIEVPLIMYQDREDTISGGSTAELRSLSSYGFGDVRVVPKLQLLFLDRHGVDVAVMPSLTLPSGGSTNYRGDTGVTFTPELAASRPVGPLRAALNLAYVLRKNVTVLNQRVEDEVLFRAGLAHELQLTRFANAPRVQLDAMVSGGFAASAAFKRSNQTPLELLLQANVDLAPLPLLAFVGTGIGLVSGFGTPDWRVFLGARFGWVDDDPDRDGLKGETDACPRAPEDFDGYEDENGCPDPDNDGDGVLDVDDKCVSEPEDMDGFEDADGCPDPDNDQDGILDAADKCPMEAEDKDAFEDEEGCADPDNDQDGILDAADKCPLEPEDKDSFEDEDGCADLDNDQDTLPDTIDRCVNEAGPVENAGCPDTDRDGDTVVDRSDNCPDEPGDVAFKGCKQKQLVTLTATRIEILDKVYFATAKAVIETRSYPLLENVAQVILAHPEVGKISVEGHTDDRGSVDYNTKLSQERADAVVAFLVSKGVPAERLQAKGFGPARPIESNKSERGRANNRRVEFNLVGTADSTIEKR